MKNFLNTGLQAKVFAVLLFFTGCVFAQSNPYQQGVTAKSITTAKDTVTVPYVKGTKVSGVVTNESDSADMKVWFSKRDSSSVDTNSYALLGPGKVLKFSFFGRKIFRQAAAGSVFSQVIYGDDIYITPGPSITGLTPNFSGYLHQDSLTGDYSFTGSNTFNIVSVDTLISTFDSTKYLKVTRSAEIDSLNVVTFIQLNGTDINTGGTLSNVFYLDQDNSSTGINTFNVNVADTSVSEVDSTKNLIADSTRTNALYINGVRTYGVADTTKLAKIDASNNWSATQQMTMQTATTITVLTGGGLISNGYIQMNRRILSNSDTLLSTDCLVLHETGGPGEEIFMPDPAVNAGKIFIVKNIGLSESFLLNPNIGETFDAAASITVASFESYTLWSDGTNWLILAKK